jgi:hypothetical protein
VRNDFEGVRSSITAGVTTRDQVRNLLGEPAIASDRWRFEVYHAVSGRDIGIFGPIIPLVVLTGEVILYALVVYDENNIVTEIDWDVFGHKPNKLIFFDTAEAVLRAGGFEFISFDFKYGGTRVEMITAPKPYSQHILRASPRSSMCSLFLPLDKFTKVSLNGTPLLKDAAQFSRYQYIYRGMLQYAATKSQRIPLFEDLVFVMLTTPHGVHQLTVRILGKRYLIRNFHRDISCTEDKNIYVQLETTVVDQDSILGGKLIGELVLSDTPQEIFSDRRLLLYAEGKWFGEH